MRRVSAVGGALLLAVSLLGACGDDGGDDESGTGDAATSIDATATDYEFEGLPETVAAGAVTVNLSNEGEELHELALIKINGSQSLAEVNQAMVPVVTEEGSPIPEFVTAAGGATQIDPGDEISSTVTLEEGRYAVLCFVEQGSLPEGEGAEGEGEEAPSEGAGEEGQGEAQEEEQPGTPHSELGMAAELTVVAGEAATADDLDADATVVAKDYTFEVPQLEPGDHTLTLRNDGPDQLHHGVLFKFAAGTAASAVPGILGQMFSSQEEPTGPPPFEEAGGSSVFGPGFAGTFDVSLEEGTYAFVCFIQDRQGGPPHAVAHQMYTAFEVG